jgi:serine/threonine protein kinase
LILKRGAYSKILLASYWDKIVIIKQIEINKINYEKFIDELEMILENPNPLCNKIVGYTVTSTQIHILFNFTNNECCNLFNLIHQKKLILPIEDLKKYINSIIQIIDFYHKKNILITYKDLKLQNIFISNDGKNLFADIFGYSTCFYTNKSKDIKYCGTITHMPPELFLGEKYDFPVDIYLFGMTLYEIFSTKTPYEGMKEKDIIIEVVKGNRPDFNYLRSDTPVEFVELIMKCLEKDPLKRPNSNDILYFLKE